GKGQHLHPEELREREVPKLVDEDEDAYEEDEIDEIHGAPKATDDLPATRRDVKAGWAIPSDAHPGGSPATSGPRACATPAGRGSVLARWRSFSRLSSATTTTSGTKTGCFTSRPRTLA